MYLTNVFNQLDSPLRDFAELRNEMNRLFNNYDLGSQRAFPAVNLWTNSDGAVITAEIPGVKEKDIKLTATNNMLTIEGSRQPDELKRDERYHRRERKCGNFKRDFEIPFSFDSEKISATYKNGILSVKLPKREDEKPRQIKINAN